MNNPVEGQDWIFDRYAFLGIDSGASDREIELAIRRLRAQNHPDRLENLDEKIKELAKRTMKLVHQVIEILTDPAKKAEFDKILDQFKQTRPELVSQTGTPILSMAANRMDLQSLSRPLVYKDETKVQDLINQQYPDNSALLKSIKDMYAAQPESETVRVLYLQQLILQLNHLRVRENIIFRIAGYSRMSDTGHMIQHPDEYGEELLRIRDEAMASFPLLLTTRSKFLALGLQVPQLLLDGDQDQSSPGEPSQLPAVPTFEKTISDLRETFKKRTAALDDVGNKIQKVLDEILELTRYSLLHEAQEDIQRYITVLFRDQSPILALQYSLETGESGLFEFEVNELSQEELQNLWETGDQVYRVDGNHEAFGSNFLMEAVWVLQQVVQPDEAEEE